jgi:hypothetical protein
MDKRASWSKMQCRYGLRRKTLLSYDLRSGGHIGTTRRTFVAQLSSVGGVVLACSASSLFAEPRSFVSRADLIGQMKWMNQPEWSKVSGGQITVRTKSKTDFWRKTFYGYVN